MYYGITWVLLRRYPKIIMDQINTKDEDIKRQREIVMPIPETLEGR